MSESKQLRVVDNDRDEIICEACDQPCHLDTAVLSEDCWFCSDCYAQFKADFDRCEHVWTPHVGVNGDVGRVCTKCSGFVIDEEAQS